MNKKKERRTANCKECGIVFTTAKDNQIFCKVKCGYEYRYNKSGKKGRKYDIPTAHVWKISEMSVATELMKLGYNVFYALSASSYCDLIAVKNKKVFHIEVRTGYESDDGKVSFGKTLKSPADTFAVFERNNENIIFYNKNVKKIKL